MFKFSISFLRIILLTSAIFILTFILGAHFHKDSIWPFGKGYYAEFKLLKKYGSNKKLIFMRKMAEEVRFELTVGANPRRFSRPVH
jgi:hypothetical protein